MGGSKSTTTQTTAYDPAYMARANANIDKANAIADTPFTPYSGERVAGFTQPQQQSFGYLTNVANDPTTSNAYQASLNTTGGLLNYTPQQVQAGQLSNTDLTPYYNPYQKDVIDASIAQNQYARDQQAVADNASATAANAFGGSRQGVQRAETTAGYDRNNQQNLAQLNSQNFAQAQQAALADINNRLQAGTTNAANSIAGAGVRLNAANSNAALGQGLLNSQIQQGGILYGIGAQQQSQQQALDDAAYQEFLRQIQYPIDMQNIRNTAFGAYPVQASTTNTTQKSGDIFGGILGALSGGAKVGSSLYGG